MVFGCYASWEKWKLGHEMRPSTIESPGENFTASVRDQQSVLKLSGSLAVPRHCSPAIWPGLILPSTFTNHRLDRKHMARLHHTNRFIFGIVWYVGGCMEKFVDPMSTIASNNWESICLGVFLNDVSQFSVSDARLHCVDGLHQAFICSLNEFPCSFIHIANEKGLV